MFARGIVCTEYALTDNGKELRNAIIPLLNGHLTEMDIMKKVKAVINQIYTRNFG
jgi:hypothetical protein